MSNRRFFRRVAAAITLAACADTTSPPATHRHLSATVPSDPPAAGFLAAFMTGTDEHAMYYALSTDGRHFAALNAGHPVLRSTLDDRLVRDPTLFRDRAGRYHVVATVSWRHRAVVMWDSDDLVTWTNERLIRTGPAKSTKAWAPDIVYDRQRNRYVLVVTADEGTWPTTGFYAMTTTDFETFSRPTLIYRDPFGAVIDASIVSDSDTYHLFFRRDGIFHATATDVMGPYTVSEQITPELLEGPFAFKTSDGSGWTLVLDNWQSSSGYTVMQSHDLDTWTRITNPAPPLYNDSVSFPAGVRHGSVLPVSRAEVDTLQAVFGRRAQRR